LGGAKDEDRPWRRLLDRLEERIEGFVGDLVRFVDDEDLVAVAGGLVANVFAQLAHLVDAAVGGGVDLDDVGGVAAGDLAAAGAFAARRRSRAVDAVQAAGEDAGDGRFAGAALAGEDVPMRDAVLRDGVLERGLDVLLVDHVAKRLGPIFAGDYLVHGAGGSCQAPGNPRHT